LGEKASRPKLSEAVGFDLGETVALGLHDPDLFHLPLPSPFRGLAGSPYGPSPPRAANGLLKGLLQPLQLRLPPLHPVRRPDPVYPPSEALQNLLPEAVEVSRA